MEDNETLLLNAKAAAALVGVDRSVWSEMKSAGELPPPVRMRKRDYWSRDTLKVWLKQREGQNNGNEQQ